MYGRGTASPGTRARGVPDAGARAVPARVPSATAGALLLHSKSLDRRIVDLYDEAYLSSSSTKRQIDSWKEIAAAIGEFKSIDRLVLLVHGNPGRFLFGGPDAQGTFAADMALTDAAKQLERMAVKATVRSVDLGGCNVGLDVDGVVAFGLALGAADVVATNHFHEFAFMKLEAPRGKSAMIEQELLRVRGYVATRDADALAEQAKTRNVSRLLLLEWYVAFKEEAALALPSRVADTNLRAKTFKRPAEALPIQVAGKADLDALRSDFSQFAGGGPVRRLIRIEVKLDGFRAAPDAGSPAPKPTGSRDAGRRAALDADPSVRPAGALPVRGPVAAAIESRDLAVVGEVFRRGGSIGDALGVLHMRALRKVDTGVAPAGPGPGPAKRGHFTLEDRGLLRDQEPSPQAQRRADDVEALRPLVSAAYDEFVAAVRREFQGLQPDVAKSFTPIKEAPYVDPYATAEEKYRAMRGAYYRAGWTCMKRDVFDRIVPAKFFGAPIVGGVHDELKTVLARVEDQVQAEHPELAKQQNAAGFSIGGFVPRLQAGSDQLSNHAFGLAIDIDAAWNPVMKSPRARKAFARATGDDIGRWLYAASSLDAVQKAYERVKRMSASLRRWLDEWMPKYEQLLEERAKAAKEANAKQRVAAVDKELAANPDLAALVALIDEYKRPVVQSWRAYGIVTIPPEVVVAFTKLGRGNGARWGGEYADSKDIMHLELLRLADAASLAKPGGPGRRAPAPDLVDLWTREPPAPPDCRVRVRAPAGRRAPVQATRG